MADADRLNEIREWAAARAPGQLSSKEWQQKIRDLLAALDAAEQQAEAAEARLAETQKALQQANAALTLWEIAEGPAVFVPAAATALAASRAALTPHPEAGE